MITLRPAKARVEDFDEEAWRAEMRRVVKYKGPPVPEEEWNKAIDEMFRSGNGVTI